MKITVIYHGQLKKFNNGDDQQSIDIHSDSTVQNLLHQLDVPRQYIAFVAVNGTRSNMEYTLQEGDVAKLYQPVGGG